MALGVEEADGPLEVIKQLKGAGFGRPRFQTLLGLDPTQRGFSASVPCGLAPGAGPPMWAL